MKFKRILSALLAFSVVMTSWTDINAAAEADTGLNDTSISGDSSAAGDVTDDDVSIEDDSTAADEEEDKAADDGDIQNTTDEGISDSFEVTIDENDMLIWSAVEDAVSYKVYCKMGENSYEISTESTYEVLPGKMCICLLRDWMSNAECIPGEYVVEVYAEKSDSTTTFIGNDTYVFYEHLDWIEASDILNLEWTEIEGSTGYRLEVSDGTTVLSHEFSTNRCENFKKVFFEDKGILPGKSYDVKVYSTDSSGSETLTGFSYLTYVYPLNSSDNNEISWKEIAGIDHYVIKGKTEENENLFSYECYTNRTLKHMQYFAEYGCPEFCQLDIYWVDSNDETGLIGSYIYTSAINDSCMVWDPKFTFDDATGMLAWEDHNPSGAYDLSVNGTIFAASGPNLCLPIYLASYYCTYDSKCTGDLVISVNSDDGYTASDYYFCSYDGCDAVTTISVPANLKVENREISWDSVDGAVGYISEFIGPSSPYPFHVTSYVHMPINIDSTLSSWADEGNYQVRTCAVDINGDRSEFSDYVTFTYNPSAEDDDGSNTGGVAPGIAVEPKYQASGEYTFVVDDYGLNTIFDEVEIDQYGIKGTDIVTVTANYAGEKDVSDLLIAVSARTPEWEGYTGVCNTTDGNSFSLTTTVKEIIEWNLQEQKFDSASDASHLVFTFWNSDDADVGLTFTYDIKIMPATWTPNFAYNETTGMLTWDPCDEVQSSSNMYYLYEDDKLIGSAWGNSVSLPILLVASDLDGTSISGDVEIKVIGDVDYDMEADYTADATYAYSYDGCDINESLAKITNIYLEDNGDFAFARTENVENAVGYIFEFKNGDNILRSNSTGSGGGYGYIGYSYFWDALGISDGGEYQARVCTVDINGDRSEFSDYFTFTYTPAIEKYVKTGTKVIGDNDDGTTDTAFLRIYNTDYAFAPDDVIDITLTYNGTGDTSKWAIIAMGFDTEWYGWNGKFSDAGTLRLSTTVERLMAANNIINIEDFYGVDLSVWHVDPSFVGESFDYNVRIIDKDKFEYPEPTRIEIPEGYSFYETGTITVTPDEDYGVYAKFPWVEATEYAFDENDEITVSFEYDGELDASGLKAAVFGFTEDFSGWNGLWAEKGTYSLTVTAKEIMEHNSMTDISELYGICGDIWDLSTDFIGEEFTYTVAIKPADVDSRDITKAITGDGVLMESLEGFDRIVVTFRPQLVTECGHEHSEEELAVNEYCTWSGICFAGAVSGGVMGYDAWLQTNDALFNANIDGEGGEEFEFAISVDYYRQCMENDYFFEDGSIIEKMTIAFWNGDVVSVIAEKDTRETLALTYDNGPVAVARIDNDWFENGSIQGDYHLKSDEIVRNVTTFGELRKNFKEIVYDGFTFKSDTVGGNADDYTYCLYLQTDDFTWVGSDRIELGETIRWDVNSIMLNDSDVIIDYGVQFGFNALWGMSETVDALEFGDVFIINPAESENPVTSIELDCEEITIREGEQIALLATVLPENATNPEIVWTTGDYRIATVDSNGWLCGATVGTVKIAATAENKTAYCVVTVVEAPDIEAPEVSVEVDNDTVFLAWEEVEGAAEYKVYRSLSEDGEKELLATTDSFVYTDIVEEDGEYYYYVTAVNAEGEESLYSSLVYANIVISARVPSNIVLTAGDGTLSVKWDAESRAEKYKLSLYVNGKYTLVSDSITATEYKIENLQPGYEYGVLILSYSNGGWSSFEEEDIKYAAPTGSFIPVVSAPAVSDGKVSLSWKKVSGATSYRLYRASSKTGTKTRIAIITQTSYVDASVLEGKTYYYFVQAYNTNTASGSSYSGAVSAAVPYSAPATPAISSVSASTGSVTVAWKKISGATSYRLYRADSLTGTKTLIKAVTTASYTDTTVTAGNTYYYFLTAYSSVSGLSSAYSAGKSVTVPKPVTPLAKPVVTVVSGGGNATVTWNEVPEATSYRVFRSTSLTGARSLIKVRTSTYFIDNSVKTGSTYYYFVLAYNANNGAKSAYSAAKSIKIVNTFNVTPVIKTGTVSNKSATISWNVVPGATSYRIYRLANGRRTLLASQSMTEYTDKTVTNGSTYTYQIKAYSATTKALTEYSNKKILKIIPAPVITGGNVLGKITWGSVSGATSYRIYRATSLTGSKTLIKTVNSTSYTDTTAVNGKLYYYFVAAYDSKTGTLTDYSNFKLIQIKK